MKSFIGTAVPQHRDVKGTVIWNFEHDKYQVQVGNEYYDIEDRDIHLRNSKTLYSLPTNASQEPWTKRKDKDVLKLNSSKSDISVVSKYWGILKPNMKVLVRIEYKATMCNLLTVQLETLGEPKVAKPKVEKKHVEITFKGINLNSKKDEENNNT